MLRRLSLVLIGLSALPAHAALWPELFSGFKRVSFGPAPIQDKAVWQEYGLEESELARYESPKGSFTALAFRLKDPTSALAVYQWRMPQGAKPSGLHKVAVETAAGAHMILGNYCITIEGRTPTIEEIQELFVILPRLDQSALPALAGFLPTDQLIAASPRFIIGPESLAKFEPRIPPSVAMFSMGAEVQLGRFRSPAGELSLAILSYPTPHIARERIVELEKLPGAVAKRSGPLVAVTFKPPSPDEAEKLLAKVNYHATLTLDQNPAKVEPTFAEFIMSVFKAIGWLLGFTFAAGLAHAGVRIALRKWFGRSDDGERLLTLDIGGK